MGERSGGKPTVEPDAQQLSNLRQIRARLSERARKIREENPHIDPVQGLVDVLGDVVGEDYDTWREILDEPYG